MWFGRLGWRSVKIFTLFYGIEGQGCLYRHFTCAEMLWTDAEVLYKEARYTVSLNTTIVTF